MSKCPIILLAGNAGSGKDTVGSYLVENYGAVAVAQADPMKRFAAEIFGFSEDQLWGPSSSRNAPDQSTVEDREAISYRFQEYVLRALDRELFAQVIPKPSFAFALDALNGWFGRIRQELDHQIPVSPRLMLQTLGTEWGRHVSRNMWNEYATNTCMKLLAGGYRYSRTEGLILDESMPGYDFGVITDGRFRNEVILTTMKGGSALRINRQNPDKAAVEAGGVKGHASEAELARIPRHFFTALVDNNRDLDHLYAVIALFMDRNYRVERYLVGRNGPVAL
jgi:hypothetical protein